jgi:hypothetical protein
MDPLLIECITRPEMRSTMPIQPGEAFPQKRVEGALGELGMGVVGRQYPVLLILYQECSLI